MSSRIQQQLIILLLILIVFPILILILFLSLFLIYISSSSASAVPGNLPRPVSASNHSSTSSPAHHITLGLPTSPPSLPLQRQFWSCTPPWHSCTVRSSSIVPIHKYVDEPTSQSSHALPQSFPALDPFASSSSQSGPSSSSIAADPSGPSSNNTAVSRAGPSTTSAVSADQQSGPMPTHRQKAAAAAAETRALFPSIPHLSGTDPTSYFYPFTAPLPRMPENARFHLRSAVLEGDPFDIALDWQSYMFPDAAGTTAGERAPPCFFKSASGGAPTKRIVVLNTCSEKKAGGDWEGGFLGLGAEESLARRSNLVQCLTATDPRNQQLTSYYPLPQTGGIYSPSTVVLRGGHEKDYALYDERDWTVISVISAAAVRRPKVDETGMRYSFAEEKELQKEKMKTVLRIAAQNGHINLVLGGFGSCGPGIGSCRIGIGADGYLTGNHGYGADHHHTPPRSQALSATTSAYKNPLKDVCKLWKELLFDDPEFRGYFANAVFAVSGGEGGGQREFRKYFGCDFSTDRR